MNLEIASCEVKGCHFSTSVYNSSSPVNYSLSYFTEPLAYFMVQNAFNQSFIFKVQSLKSIRLGCPTDKGLEFVAELTSVCTDLFCKFLQENHKEEFEILSRNLDSAGTIYFQPGSWTTTGVSTTSVPSWHTSTPSWNFTDWTLDTSTSPNTFYVTNSAAQPYSIDSTTDHTIDPKDQK